MVAQPHSHEHVHADEDDHGHVHGRDDVRRYDEVVEERDVAREVHRSYLPAQLTALGMGLFFGVIAGIALMRTGISAGDVRTPTTEVLGIGMTPLLAYILLGIGVLALLSSPGRAFARATMLFFGPIMLAAGAVVLFRPDILQEWLNMNRVNGIAYVVAGGVAVAAVIGTPITWTRRVGQRRVHGRRMATN